MRVALRSKEILTRSSQGHEEEEGGGVYSARSAIWSNHALRADFTSVFFVSFVSFVLKYRFDPREHRRARRDPSSVGFAATFSRKGRRECYSGLSFSET
jgi:hypothetical protein